MVKSKKKKPVKKKDKELEAWKRGLKKHPISIHYFEPLPPFPKSTNP